MVQGVSLMQQTFDKKIDKCNMPIFQMIFNETY